MYLLHTKKISNFYQVLFCNGFVLLTAIICVLGSEYIEYRATALIMLMVVSINAMLFDILPVLSAALLSALIWNYYFIPPTHTFHIGQTEDILLFFLYFFISLINAVLTIQIRKSDHKARKAEENVKIIQLYDTLINSLSHELRTPISAIKGAAEILSIQKDVLNASQQNELLLQIDIATERLNKQVENLLSMNRIESGMLQLNKGWHDINELIQYVVNHYHLPIKQNIVFTPITENSNFYFDRILLEQVVYNVFDNAVQYTSPTSTIDIQIFYKNAHVQIVVIDNGGGIPEENLPLICNKFYRLPNTKSGGCGLGLSIVKGFIEAQNGSVKIQNNEKNGTTVMIEFPSDKFNLNHA